ncbi:MAG: AzlC family ABC transporter permease [Firmicutes bacterium]|jgi:predicted branched-subunit amino acid permease|nr:AzlC family ABC transporter permease [Bacillota bacterium]MBQ1825466.1 AzlC family ABC transporter permease [Bacillota bacterium]
MNREFKHGFKLALPIGIGYFAVAFSLGIAARSAGLNAFQGFLASLLENASAGEYAGFSLIAAQATYVEVMIMTLIANARYLLMAFAMSTRLDPDVSMRHRLVMAFDVTDELFAISIARPGNISPYFYYGAMCASMPLWAGGTAVGIVAGSILPEAVVSALGVALFGMFIACIIPEAKKNKLVACIIAISFLLSWLFGILPGISEISEGTRTIILTLLIAGAAAALFPVKEEAEDAA